MNNRRRLWLDLCFGNDWDFFDSGRLGLDGYSFFDRDRSFVDDLNRRDIICGEFFDHGRWRGRDFFLASLIAAASTSARSSPSLAWSSVRVWSFASAAIACAGIE